MWVKQCHKPPMTGNGKFIPPIYGDLGDGLLLFYPHYDMIMSTRAWFFGMIIYIYKFFYQAKILGMTITIIIYWNPVLNQYNSEWQRVLNTVKDGICHQNWDPAMRWMLNHQDHQNHDQRMIKGWYGCVWKYGNPVVAHRKYGKMCQIFSHQVLG